MTKVVFGREPNNKCFCIIKGFVYNTFGLAKLGFALCGAGLMKTN